MPLAGIRHHSWSLVNLNKCLLIYMQVHAAAFIPSDHSNTLIRSAGLNAISLFCTSS